MKRVLSASYRRKKTIFVKTARLTLPPNAFQGFDFDRLDFFVNEQPLCSDFPTKRNIRIARIVGDNLFVILDQYTFSVIMP